MADIISKEVTQHKGRKHLSTRIDLTPMVDLGFILITFFLFTTSLLQPNTITIHMPDETPTPHPSVIPDHEAVKVFLTADHQLFFLTGLNAMKNNFQGLDMVSLKDEKTFRQTILQWKENVDLAVQRRDKGTHPGDEPFVLIKPTSHADYGDLINVIDELSINGLNRYVIVDLDEEEKKRFES